MRAELLTQSVETLEGEHLKSIAEIALHGAAKLNLEPAFRLVRGGDLIEDDRLNVDIAGMRLENPIMVGAGWDKKGRAVDGLYRLGFSGVEVGSVLVHPQAGNPKPRLWIDKTNKAVGLNRLGFNSAGQEEVAKYLNTQALPGVTGISLGKNKLTPDSQAPWAHAAVADRLHDYADYFAINVASPNTPGLRKLLDKGPLTEMVLAVKEVLDRKGQKPLFVKTTVDLADEDLDVVLEVCIELGVDGVIDSNTTIDDKLKSLYGWSGEMGGLSGANPEFRRRCNERMKYITKQTRGTGLQRIGVGAINDADSALERIEAGAQVLQVVTGIRETRGRVARNINLGLLHCIEQDGAQSIADYTGVAA
jgi:dihydroorotate dehydrogenase